MISPFFVYDCEQQAIVVRLDHPDEGDFLFQGKEQMLNVYFFANKQVRKMTFFDKLYKVYLK